MDESQTEALVRRLVANPHDPTAIAEAHAAGHDDPEGYGLLLERVGQETPAPALASHWLTEAANVWLTTFEDPHRAAIALMAAVDRDPAADAPASRLAQLYADSGDHKALAALYERRAGALAKGFHAAPEHKGLAASLYQELGRMWTEPPLSDLRRARQAYVKAVELDDSDQYAIYSLREIYKAAQEFTLALPLFQLEQDLEADPERKLSLYLDEAAVAASAHKPEKVVRALRNARALDPEDAALKQQLGSVVLEKLRAGQTTVDSERRESCDLFVELAEEFPGEHGFLYSLCALELVPGNDRAMQLAIYYGEQEQRLDEVALAAGAYLVRNPGGPLAQDARRVAGDARSDQSPVARKPEGSVARKPEGSVARKPEGSVARKPEGSVARKAEGSVARKPEGSVARKPEGSVARKAEGPIPSKPAFVAPAEPAVPYAEEEPVDDLELLLDKASKLAEKNRRNEAISVYREVLRIDPAQAEALEYLLEHLPQKRKHAQLRDVLVAAAATAGAPKEQRVNWLKEVANLSENQLKETDQAVNAWREILQLGSDDVEAREQLRRLLEKARRWDDLAEMLEAEAAQTEDFEVRISLEKQIAKLHSERRKDPAGAGQAWARIAQMLPGEEPPVLEAVKFFERAERDDLAVTVISENVADLEDEKIRRDLYSLRAKLLVGLDRSDEAARALAESARALADLAMWEEAESLCVQLGAWEDAAVAACERAALTQNGDEGKASLLAEAARYLLKAGAESEAIRRLQAAVELAPSQDEFAVALEQLLADQGRAAEVVRLCLSRADRISDPVQRADLCRRAALLCSTELHDAPGARDAYLRVLADNEDEAALNWLANDALARADAPAAVDYLHRLSQVLNEPDARVEVLLQEAELRAKELGDPDGALDQYTLILSDLDPKNEQAIRLSIQLQLERGDFAEAAALLEIQLEVAASEQSRLKAATALADLYEQHLGRQADAMRVLALLHEADPDDFAAAQRLCNLAEKTEDWSLFARLMAELIAVEGDETEISHMSRRLARVLCDRLDQGEAALAVLGDAGDGGDEACRVEFVRVGDALNSGATVARRLIKWHLSAPASANRSEALSGAFERLVNAGEDAEAVSLAKELARSLSAPREMADLLEPIAVELKDLDALSLAHELKVSDLSGNERAEEFVRQAEVLCEVGVPPTTAISHGEQAFQSLAPAAAERQLQRLAKLADDPASNIDVYARQVSRCKAADDRLAALCRAAEVAVEQGDLKRAGGFFDVALGSPLNEEGLERLLSAARTADDRRGVTDMRRALAEAFARGGQGVRDGGKTRSNLLARAAALASDELNDLDKAFEWLARAACEHAGNETLDALEELAKRADDFARAEAVLDKALDEVFDGPLVRRLLARRADIRRNRLGDAAGAAEDLKRLHDLSPADEEVSDELCALFEQLGDYQGMVQLHEDQILRSRDPERRAALARKVALLWQDNLADPRESADAWRRVLRLSSRDAEAKEGLARAKESMLGEKTAEVLEEARIASEALAQAEAERLEAEQAEAERLEAEQAEAARLEAEQAEAERLEAEQAEAKRLEAEQAEAKRLEAEQAEAKRLEAEQAEAERLEAEQAEAERPEAEQAEAERIKAYRAEAERLEVEEAEAERTEAKRLELEARAEAERLELERIEAELEAVSPAGAAKVESADERTAGPGRDAPVPNRVGQGGRAALDKEEDDDDATSPNRKDFVALAQSAEEEQSQEGDVVEQPPVAALTEADHDDNLDEDDNLDRVSDEPITVDAADVPGIPAPGSAESSSDAAVHEEEFDDVTAYDEVPPGDSFPSAVDNDDDDEFDADEALLVDEDDDFDETPNPLELVARPMSIPPPLPPGRPSQRPAAAKRMPPKPPSRVGRRELPAPPPPPRPPRPPRDGDD